MRSRKTRPVCLAFSPGGHRAQLRLAVQDIELGRVYEVTFRPGNAVVAPILPTVHRSYYLVHPRRRLFRFLVNLAQSVAVLARNRPWLIISTGADVALATVVIGKVLFRAKIIYIETCGTLTPTMTGRICYRFSDLFIVQWPELLSSYPSAVLSSGQLL